MRSKYGFFKTNLLHERSLRELFLEASESLASTRPLKILDVNLLAFPATVANHLRPTLSNLICPLVFGRNTGIVLVSSG